MSLKYELVQRKDMSEGAGPDAKLYYPQLVGNGEVSFDDLCEQIAEESALTSADVKGVMDRLVRVLSRNLKEGRKVDCGELGSFRITVRSTGSITKEQYDANTMMRLPKVVFNIGKKLRDMRETKITFERITPKEDEEAEEGA